MIKLRRFPGDGNKLTNSEIWIGDIVLMLADNTDGWPSIPAHVHTYVSDVDATYQRVLAAGATWYKNHTSKMMPISVAVRHGGLPRKCSSPEPKASS